MKNQIVFNIKAHDKVCQRYENEHGEIYNEFEQKRLRDCLKKASEKIETESAIIKAMDFGSGSGNLTRYLLEMNMQVTAADVSQEFLKLIKYKYADKFHDKLTVLKLNGEDMANIKDDTFDFIATYSVLHHIPDYLLAIKELARILKPGGVLYIDHEAAPDVWNLSEELSYYRKMQRQAMLKITRYRRFRHLFMPSFWVSAFKEILDPKFKIEGDIHVHQDDHIEWNDVQKILQENNMEIILLEKFLLRTKYCSQELYDMYKSKCFDTQLVIARKNK